MRFRGFISIVCFGIACFSGSVRSQTKPDGRDVKLERASASVVTRELPSNKKRWALVVGVDKYSDRQISPLFGATNDASSIADALVQYAGFPQEQVILLSSSQPEERQPTRSNIVSRLANLSHLVPKDGLFLMAFAGHGIERNGRAFLMPMDAKMSDDVRVLEATGIGVDLVKEWIDDMKVQQVLMLVDACRNDPAAGRSAGDNALSDTFRRSFNFEARNKAVVASAILYATAVGHRAYEYAEKRQGYFSWAVVEGLKGGAASPNGEVTLAGLEKFVQEKVPERIRIDLGPDKDQKPFAEVRGYKAGELVLARIDPKHPVLVAPTAPAIDPRIAQLEEWEQLRTTTDPAALLEFLKRYPNGPFTGQVNDRLDHLRWNAVNQKDQAAVQAFRQQYPQSVHAAEAQRLLEQFQEALAGSNALQTAVKQYVEAYNSRDIEALKAVWPTLSKKQQDTIQDSFKHAKSLRLDLEPVGEAQIKGDTALVTFRRVLQSKDDRGPELKIADTMTLRMQKRATAWVIVAIQ